MTKVRMLADVANAVTNGFYLVQGTTKKVELIGQAKSVQPMWKEM